MEKKHKTIIAYYLGRKEDNPAARWLDRVICFFTRSKYSHVELVYDYSEVTQIGLCWSASPRDKGVRPQRIDFNTGRWELYEVPTEFTQEEIVAWFNEKRKGADYDWFGALGAYWPLFRGNPNKWFCVEIVGECLGVSGASRMTPKEMFKYFMPAHRRIVLKKLD